MKRNKPLGKDFLGSEDLYSQAKGVDPKDFRDERKYNTVTVPMRRGLIRNMTKKPVNHLDIHWRNTALLTKFLTGSATIRTRFSTGLPRWQQVKMARTIKHARTLNLIPYTGFIKSFHRQSLKTIHEDLETTNLRRVDVETGALKMRQLSDEWREENRNRKAQDKLDKYDETIDLSSYNITNYEFLSKEQDQLVKAMRYANYRKEEKSKRNGIDVEWIKNHLKNTYFELYNANYETKSTPDTLEQDKQAYEEIQVPLSV